MQALFFFQEFELGTCKEISDIAKVERNVRFFLASLAPGPRWGDVTVCKRVAAALAGCAS